MPFSGEEAEYNRDKEPRGACESNLVAFELAAFFLTVALVAAVYVARRKASDLTPLGGDSEGAA